MSSTNRGAERNEADFYPTPIWATLALLTAVPDEAIDAIGPLLPVIDETALGDFARGLIRRAEPNGATVALLLRLAFLETATRAPFHREHPADIYPFATRPSFVVDGKTDSTAYAWWVWGPGRGGRWHAPLLKPEGTRR